jgi:phosphatidylglycerophosphate synthase
MFDAKLRRYIDPSLNRIARDVAQAGISADYVTLAGAFAGLWGAAAIAISLPLVGLALFLAGRVLDGLDGAVARQTKPTNLGAYLDIVLDFVVYAAIPLGFAIYNPSQNAVAAAVLLASFLLNGAAFLGFALMAEKLHLETQAQGHKSLYYLGGLAEGGETIVCFTLMCLLPGWFAVIALGFAALCTVSGAARIVLAWRLLDGS